jgi:hypothetical protein
MVKIKEIEKSTEVKILEAAKQEFLERGFDGARMQKIAERAEINKALLHYYFRSKENLFKAIFQSVFENFFPKVVKTFQSEISFFDKLKFFIDNYIDVLSRNPFLPAFILHEVQLRPEMLINSIKEQGFNPTVFLNLFKKEMDKGIICTMPVEHLVVNILSMCIFPVAAAPIIKGMVFKNDDKEYQKFLEERKIIVYQFVINSIKK